MLASDVLSTLDKPTIVCVIPETVPVNVGEAKGAFNASAAVALVTSAAKLVVNVVSAAVALVTSAAIAVAFDVTLVVKVASAAVALVTSAPKLVVNVVSAAVALVTSAARSTAFAFKFKAVCVAVETGLAASEVLSTFPNPRSPLTIPKPKILDF